MQPSEPQNTAPTLDDVWRLFAETDRRFQETERLLKEQSRETGRLLKEQSTETDRLFKEQAREFDRKLEETERLFKQQSRETDRLLKEQSRETDRQIKAQSKETGRLENLFTSQWGKLMESLVEGDIIGILTRYGVPVRNTSTRVKGHTDLGEQFEFDIVAHNGEIIVVIEVKTTLRAKNVSHFIKKLNSFKSWLPHFANNHIYGAMAFLTADENSVAMAEKLGLIVIRATGNSASIVNRPDFKPRNW